MKRLSFKLMQWIQSFFKKKKNKEVKSPEIGTFDTSHLVFESLNSDKDIKDDFNVFSEIKNGAPINLYIPSIFNHFNP